MPYFRISTIARVQRELWDNILELKTWVETEFSCLQIWFCEIKGLFWPWCSISTTHMPENSMNEAIVKRTQDTLGKVIGKKPPLTEKLLNRPPFRFLHDVITSVSSTSTIAHNKTADPATITDNGCLCGSHMHLILILLLPIIILLLITVLSPWNTIFIIFGVASLRPINSFQCKFRFLLLD